jgi:hypothetical protein
MKIAIVVFAGLSVVSQTTSTVEKCGTFLGIAIERVVEDLVYVGIRHLGSSSTSLYVDPSQPREPRATRIDAAPLRNCDETVPSGSRGLQASGAIGKRDILGVD